MLERNMSSYSRQLMETGGSLNSCKEQCEDGAICAGPSDEGFTYEHFPVVCPTCKGNGRIADDEANVAIIPVEDQRLKPSRLKLKILTLLAVTLVTGGLALIFLFPRSVEITVLPTIPINYSFPKTGSPFITHETKVMIDNSNFFPVSISNFHTKLLYRMQVVGHFFHNSSVSVPIKGTEVFTSKVKAVYTDQGKKFIKQKCYNLQYQFTEEIRVSATVSYWYHSELISEDKKYVVIDCSKMLFPMRTSRKPRRRKPKRPPI